MVCLQARQAGIQRCGDVGPIQLLRPASQPVHAAGARHLCGDHEIGARARLALQPGAQDGLGLALQSRRSDRRACGI